ncbi:KilA-N domain-containing protein [Thiorhodococcus minor]|uniref:KilA-N domain-containing protein n=1 Tax=Thiorhodococcus minor TaxID=57489 RepID=A0A6M0K5C7_9GAMM|nr:KilA-N domain-containing protein [Thiorhodococcus minor]
MSGTEITVDVSLLAQTEEMYFNATEMAKVFGKRPNDWLSLPDTKAYIDALVTENAGNGDEISQPTITGKSGNSQHLILTKRGSKYGGTWLHADLGIAFARWLSPVFAVRLDKWTKARLSQERDWRQKRIEAKTGFLPMTNAVLNAHDPVKHYHFSNEADLINRIVLGMSAKDYREERGVASVRDALDAVQLHEINRLQIINTGLIEVGMDFQERKAKLIECHRRGLTRLAQAA